MLELLISTPADKCSPNLENIQNYKLAHPNLDNVSIDILKEKYI